MRFYGTGRNTTDYLMISGSIWLLNHHQSELLGVRECMMPTTITPLVYLHRILGKINDQGYIPIQQRQHKLYTSGGWQYNKIEHECWSCMQGCSGNYAWQSVVLIQMKLEVDKTHRHPPATLHAIWL